MRKTFAALLDPKQREIKRAASFFVRQMRRGIPPADAHVQMASSYSREIADVVILSFQRVLGK